MTYDIYHYALDILKAHQDYNHELYEKFQGDSTKMMVLSEASAYATAWWILNCAIHEDWDGIEKFDPKNWEKEDNENDLS